MYLRLFVLIVVQVLLLLSALVQVPHVALAQGASETAPPAESSPPATADDTAAAPLAPPDVAETAPAEGASVPAAEPPGVQSVPAQSTPAAQSAPAAPLTGQVPPAGGSEPAAVVSPAAHPAPGSEASAAAPAAEAPIAEAPTAEAPTERSALEDGLVAPDDDGVIDVTVAGTKLAKTAGSAHILTPQQLEQFEYDDPHAALLQVPGVNVRQEDGAGLRPNISLRGVNPDRSKKVTLMEDGVLFGPAPYSAPAAYYFPLMTRMSNLRVIKGPSAIAYGPQTVGGSLDMITRGIPSMPAGYLDLGLGQFGYGKVHGYFGASDGQTGFLIEGVHLQSDGFKELPDGADTGFDRNEWMVKGSYVLDPAAEALHEFRIQLGYSDEVSNETYLGLTDGDFAVNPDRRYAASALDQMKYHRTALRLSHVFEVPSANLTLTTTAYRHDFDRTWNKFNDLAGAPVRGVLAQQVDNRYLAVLAGEADSLSSDEELLIGPNHRTYVSQGVQSVLGLGFHSGPLGHRLEAGLRLHYDSVERDHSQSAYRMLAGELVSAGAPTEVTVLNEAETLALAAHVIDAITFADLTITPGVRLEVIRGEARDHLTEKSGADTQVVPLPGVGLFYSLAADFGLLAGVYRGFSPAVVDDENGSSSAEPEFSVNYEAGARYSKRHSRAELIGFFNDYSNLTNVCTFSSGCTVSDIDRQFDGNAVHVYGLELYGEHTFRLGSIRVPWTAAYTFTRSSFRSTFVSADPTFGDVEKGDELPYLPRHQFNSTLAVKHKLASVTAGLTYTSVAREQAGGGSLSAVRTTDSLLWLDVSASIHMMAHLELYANVRNLFDQRAIVSRRPFGARPNAPRMVQVGLKGQL